MKNQAILTILADKEELLKVVPDTLSARGCEFTCSDQQVDVFRNESGILGTSCHYDIRLGLFPHAGPCPQYMTAVGEVVSVRRCAQNCFALTLNFKQVSQDGYRLIAEHLSDALVIVDHHVQSKSA